MDYQSEEYDQLVDDTGWSSEEVLEHLKGLIGEELRGRLT